MKIKLDKVKKVVRSNPVKLAGAFALGVGATYLYYERKTLLEITDADARQLKSEPGTAVYETKYGPIFVGMTDDL